MIGKYALGLAICFIAPQAFAQGVDSADPVLTARAKRVEGNGRDLPPVPKGLIEPPPLPPPEMHTHDIRKSRVQARPAAKKPAATPAKKPATPAAKPATTPAKKPATTAAKPTAQKAPATPAAKPAATPAKKPANTAAKPTAQKAPVTTAAKK